MSAQGLPYLIYIHGFNSSPQSYKAQQMLSFYDHKGFADRIVVPELPYEPAQALQLLERLVVKHLHTCSEPLLLLGSSLGGFYATYLVETYDRVRAVLVNPSVKPFELLASWLGDNENFYTAEKYCLTREHLNQLLEIDRPQPNKLADYYVLLQTGDETLDYHQAALKFQHAELVVEQGGDHSFMAFERYYSSILAFAVQQPLPAVTPLVSGD